LEHITVGSSSSRYGILVGIAAAVGTFGAAAMLSASTAPTARADESTDILNAAEDLFAVGQNYIGTATTDFSAGELAPGFAAYFAGINDELLGAPDNLIVGTVDQLTNEPFTAILDFPIPPPDSFANALTIAQEFFTGGQTSFADALTALSGGDYGLAAYDELVGLNVTSIIPLEELLLGSLAAFTVTG
jgi:hypothetical protein